MLAEKPSDVLNGVWRELPRRSEAASQISEDEGKMCSATILPQKLRRRYKWCEAIVREKTQCHWQEAGSSRHFGLPSCYRRHLSSNLTQDLHRGDLEARVGDIPCHSHQYSSAFLKHRRSRGAARGVHPRDSSIIIFIVAVVVVVVFVVSAVGFYSQRGVALLSRTDIPAKTFRSRVLWINWICANRFPLFLLVTLHLQTLISSLIHTHTYTYTLTQSHTPSHWIRNILHIHKSSMKNHNSPLPNY